MIGIGLVLSAVFLPMAFFGGSTGVIYRQFSITIVSSMVLSVLIALILTPALHATILKPATNGHHEKAGFFGWFNRTFERGREGYGKGVGKVERRWSRSLLVYAVIIGGMAVIFLRLPFGFLPEEDQGIAFTQVMLPAGTTMEETARTMAPVFAIFFVPMFFVVVKKLFRQDLPARPSANEKHLVRYELDDGVNSGTRPQEA
jgi:multidrug efflux pump subunit AcrB